MIFATTFVVEQFSCIAVLVVVVDVMVLFLLTCHEEEGAGGRGAFRLRTILYK